MVDEEIKDVSAGPTGAPVNRDARREPDVIEGEIAARETDEARRPGPGAAESRADPVPPPAPAPRAARGFLGGALAGLIVSALGLGAGYTLFAPKSRRVGDRESIERARNAGAAGQRRVAAEANRESAAVASLEKRIGALESSAGASNTADLDKRVTALEAASAGNWRRQRRDPTFGGSGQGLARRRRRREGRDSGIVGARREARDRGAEDRTPPAPISPPSPLGSTRSRARSPRPRPKRAPPPRSSAAADNATTIAIIAEVAEERLRVGRGLRTRARRPATPRRRCRRRSRRCKPWSTGRPPTARWPPRSTRLRRTCWPPPRKAETGQRDRSLPRPSPQSREGARSQRDGRRRSAGSGLPDRGR